VARATHAGSRFRSVPVASGEELRRGPRAGHADHEDLEAAHRREHVDDVPAGERDLDGVGVDAIGDVPELVVGVWRWAAPRFDDHPVAADRRQRGFVGPHVTDDPDDERRPPVAHREVDAPVDVGVVDEVAVDGVPKARWQLIRALLGRQRQPWGRVGRIHDGVGHALERRVIDRQLIAAAQSRLTRELDRQGTGGGRPVALDLGARLAGDEVLRPAEIRGFPHRRPFFSGHVDASTGRPSRPIPQRWNPCHVAP
jgi:hypothetical protein